MSIAPFLPALPTPAAVPGTPTEPGSSETDTSSGGGVGNGVGNGVGGNQNPFTDALAAALALVAPPTPLVEASLVGVEASGVGVETALAGVEASLTGPAVLPEGTGPAAGLPSLLGTTPATVVAQSSGTPGAAAVLTDAEGTTAPATDRTARTAGPAAEHVALPTTPATTSATATSQDAAGDGSTPEGDVPTPTTDLSTTSSDASTATTDHSTSTTAVSTPTGALSTVIKGDVVTRAVVQQVFPEVTQVVTAAAQGPNGTQRITLTLQPEMLGEVRVTLVVRDGSVEVRLAGDAGDGRIHQALAQSGPELQRLLERGGADARVVVRDGFTPAASASSGASSTSEQPGSSSSAFAQQQFGSHARGGLGGWSDQPGQQAQPGQPGQPGGRRTTGEAQPAATGPVPGTTNRSGRLDRAL